MKTPLLLLLVVLPVLAQPRKLSNAQVSARSASGGLEKEIQALTSSQPQPAWIGYTAPAARGRNFGCDSYNRDHEITVAGGTVHLEPPAEVLVLIRISANQVSQIRALAPDCEMDAGGVPFYWLTGVQPAASVAFLSGFAKRQERLRDSALRSIGLHAGPAAETALEQFLSAEQPESMRIRAAQWIGATRGRRGLEVLQRLLASESNEHVRKGAVRALAASTEPQALDVMIAAAKTDRSPGVRGEALRTLGQKAGQKALGAIAYAIDNDSEREVKRSAVSALRQLPDGEGVPLLIQVARSSRDPEVRKQAMSTLGHSRDPRAVGFFEEVLKRGL